ncbi:PEP-CTERM sorting domain-containing protein [Haloferula sargassicola]|uniref:Ice-binding protein C-terminal domain-containing protein n=1 Tax=Haloferula sargassicola TaxID=490096 RepID=A0ABP9UR09_9BACT
MKALVFSLLTAAAIATNLHAAVVDLRLTADSISGGSTFSGTQAWFPENQSFYGDVGSNGFDIVIRYDTASTPFNISGALGRQFNGTMVSGTIGSRDISTIDNLSVILSLIDQAGSTSLLVSARELPYGELSLGYIWNEALFSLTDIDKTMSATTLPDQASLIANIDQINASVRNSRNSAGVQGTRETGSGPSDGVTYAPVPEPSTTVFFGLAGTLALLRRRSRA